jgi:hypothetical protein
MIKTLMAMIREFVTRGVTTLVLRFTKEGAQETTKDALTVLQEGYQDS